MIPLENELLRMQNTEEVTYNRRLSDNEDEDDMFERGSELMCTSYARQTKSYTTPQMHYTQSAPAAPVKVSAPLVDYIFTSTSRGNLKRLDVEKIYLMI